jgi:hypothetical protein
LSPTRLLTLAAALALSCAAQAQLKAPAGQAPAPQAARPAPAASAAPAQAIADPEKEEAGRTVAAGWLTLLDRKDWGGAWDRSAALFRKNVPLAAWMDGVPKTRDGLGALVERQPAETVYKNALPGHPAGDYVTTIFLSRFEKKDQVQELVTTVREADGRWRVTGYSTR